MAHGFDLSPESLEAIATQFCPHAPIAQITPLGNGNINETYRVSFDGHPSLVLQRINTQVFRQPAAVMRNIRRMVDHVRDRLQDADWLQGRRWEVPSIYATQTGQDYWLDEAGQPWRAIAFIDAAATYDTLNTPELAEEVGFGLGMFHRLIRDLPTAEMLDTLEGFHITPQYLAQFDQVLATTHCEITNPVQDCLAFVGDRREFASVLETAKQNGILTLQPIHGDPKVNNVMIDHQTGHAISLVDLDTVKPGLIHYDLGDCLRSGCNPLGEETTDFDAVTFCLARCGALLNGYKRAAQDILTPNDRDYFYDAIRLLAFELGLRFLTDHLAGNVYFRTQYPDHNLARAIVQFKYRSPRAANSGPDPSLSARW
jgi:hypothetical protein